MTLNVKPRIMPSAATNIPDQVWLTVSLDDGGFESVTVDSMPMKRTTSLQTQTTIFADESIMLAGYFREIDEKAGWGIPILRDIPLIGWIFGGSSTRKETVQRMFIVTPHVVDFDVELLVRSQAARISDTTAGDEAVEGADDGNIENERRRLEREDNLQRRREKAEDDLERRKAELEHARNMRQIERAEGRDRLNDDIRAWQAEETEARYDRRIVEASREAAEKAEAERRIQAARERAAAEEALRNPPPKVRKVIEDDEEIPAK
jgi:hypothetical protein